MQIQRQHVHSTQPTSAPDPVPSARTTKTIFKVLEPKDLLATDLTGRFPVLSNRGIKYICVLFLICEFLDVQIIL